MLQLILYNLLMVKKSKTMRIKTKNTADTQKLARIFAQNLPENGAFVSLFGDIGAGKTAFVRFVLKDLGVKEKITSPSFVILNEYKGARVQSSDILVYHFDLYRLENDGLDTIKEELREYSKDNVLTFVEWADFGGGELPYNRLNIKVYYEENDYDDTRYYEFEPVGKKYEIFVQKINMQAAKEGLK